MSQRLAANRHYRRGTDPAVNETTVNQEALEELELEWASVNSRLQLIPGKEGLARVNQVLQDDHAVSLTPSAIINAMIDTEIPGEVKNLLQRLEEFATASP